MRYSLILVSIALAIVASEARSMIRPPRIPTMGGNSKGANCVFPFRYNGNTYTSCTLVGSSVNGYWCATTNNYGRHGKWGYCKGSVTKKRNASVKTLGGNGFGRRCVFPFTYKGKKFHSCTSMNSDGPWCSVTTNYMKHRKWGYCLSNKFDQAYIRRKALLRRINRLAGKRKKKSKKNLSRRRRRRRNRKRGDRRRARKAAKKAKKYAEKSKKQARKAKKQAKKAKKQAKKAKKQAKKAAKNAKKAEAKRRRKAAAKKRRERKAAERKRKAAAAKKRKAAAAAAKKRQEAAARKRKAAAAKRRRKAAERKRKAAAAKKRKEAAAAKRRRAAARKKAISYNGKLIKMPNDDKIYQVLNGKRHHILNTESYNNVYRSPDCVKTDKYTNKIPLGKSLIGAMLIKGSGPKVYFSFRGRKYHVTSPKAMDKYCYNWHKIQKTNVGKYKTSFSLS